MSNSYSKFGFSKIGGIYIGKNINSDFHKNYAITIIASFGKPFTLHSENQEGGEYQIAVIQKNMSFSIRSALEESMAFIHVVPYSEAGIRLSDSENSIKRFTGNEIVNVKELINNWFSSESNTQQDVEKILSSIATELGTNHKSSDIDERIMKALLLIMESKEDKLPVGKIAKEVCLSESHFNRLFKKETGLTFRKFVLHSKLIKSIYAMYNDNSLTEASFLGGFSDQPHLSRTFRENFGVKPSKIVK